MSPTSRRWSANTTALKTQRACSAQKSMYWTPPGPAVIFTTLPLTQAIAPIFFGASATGMHAAAAAALKRLRKTSRRRMSGRLFGRFHAQGIVEAVEVVEQADGGGQLDDFAFLEMRTQLHPQSIIYLMGIAGHALGQAQGGFFGLGEIGAPLEIGQLADLLLAPA